MERADRATGTNRVERIDNTMSGAVHVAFQAGPITGGVKLDATTHVTQRLTQRVTEPPPTAPPPAASKPEERRQLPPRSGIAALVHFVAIGVVFAAYARMFHFVEFHGWDWLQVAVTSAALKLAFSASKKAIWGRPEPIWTLVTLAAAVVGFLLGAKSSTSGDLIDFIGNWMLWNF